ncbi:MAG TPA: creatininase family protein [Gaiellales bacterium]|nr:creatininase family protein [Gaiellales bacterium]
MRLHDCTWMQVERYLEHDDRIVLPLGSTEQHAYLSLGTDAILAERVSLEAAEPLGVIVAPALPYGLAPYFAAFPGSPSLRTATYLAVVGDLLDSMRGQGFRRFLLVNGHGGNAPVEGLAAEWMAANEDSQVIVHHWWRAPKVWSVVQSIDPDAAHANWLESFEWTRLPGSDPPAESKPMVDLNAIRAAGPARARELLGDGSYGGRYRRSPADEDAVWRAGVEEVREVLAGAWA